ncbi:hypothetical protein D3C77_616270 [compost metagenome]
MLKQHNAGQNDGTWVNNIQIRIFRSSTMRSFKNRVAGNIVDVRTRRDTDSTYLSSKRIRQVVAIQVQCRNNIKICRTG